MLSADQVLGLLGKQVEALGQSTALTLGNAVLG
jgi:hypothetical protein